MNSEWLQVMLDEIARKQAEAVASRAELERRAEEVAAAGKQPPGTHALSE